MTNQRPKRRRLRPAPTLTLAGLVRRVDAPGTSPEDRAEALEEIQRRLDALDASDPLPPDPPRR